MDAVDLEVWMLKANALASSVAAGDVHEGVVEVANWLLKTYDGVAAVREELRKERAAGYEEAKEQAAKVADDVADKYWTRRDERNAEYVYCTGQANGANETAIAIRALAPATTKEPT